MQVVIPTMKHGSGSLMFNAMVLYWKWAECILRVRMGDSVKVAPFRGFYVSLVRGPGADPEGLCISSGLGVPPLVRSSRFYYFVLVGDQPFRH